MKKFSKQCEGHTKAGRQCSITSASKMTDNLGRLVASPLQRGGTHCLIHATIFCTAPTRVTDGIRFYHDLETSGLDLLSDEIVELAVMSSAGHVFSTVCRPSILPDSPSAHGISNDELLLGPDFSEALMRLLSSSEMWLRWLSKTRHYRTTTLRLAPY